MKTNEKLNFNKKDITGDKVLLESPTVKVNDKEFRPFESDGEFWGMLDAIEKESIKEYEENKGREPGGVEPEPPRAKD